MPHPHRPTISKRSVDGLPADGKDALYWDRDLTGFGATNFSQAKTF